LYIEILITIGIFLITQICVTVWWASKVNTLLSIVQQELKELILEFKCMRETYLPKETFTEHICVWRKERDKIWEKIDNLQKGTQGGKNGKLSV